MYIQNFFQFYNLVHPKIKKIPSSVNSPRFWGFEINKKKASVELLQSDFGYFLEKFFSVNYKNTKDIEKNIATFLNDVSALFKDRWNINLKNNSWSHKDSFLGMSHKDALSFFYEIMKIKTLKDIERITFNSFYFVNLKNDADYNKEMASLKKKKASVFIANYIDDFFICFNYK